MKRIILVLLVITTLSATAQESVLLRLNYNEGDNYLLTVDAKQNMGLQGGMNMNMTMGVIITEVGAKNIKTESKITSVVMDMMQGEMSMSYDSNKKEAELDQMGQMMKSQFDPMMKATIHTSLDNLGNMIETKIEPAIPGMEQLTGSASTINYPEEKVSVGSSWTSENENQGMKMTMNYTVSSIAGGVVTLDVSGDMSGAVGTGTIKGKTTIDISTGISKNSETEITIATQGMNITGSTKITVSKM